MRSKLLLDMALARMRRGERVAFCSTEEGQRSLVARLQAALPGRLLEIRTSPGVVVVVPR